MLDKKNILGVEVTSASETEILEYLVKNIKNSKKKFFLTTPNPEIIMFANKNPEYKNILNSADLALSDGVGLLWAGKILGKNIKERITGVDFVEKFCKEVSGKPITVGFLGGGPNVAELTAECLQKNYPGLKVVFVGEEWPEKEINGKLDLSLRSKSLDKRISQNQRLDQPKSALIDILFVAFGFPKQEEWIASNLGKIPVRAAMGVGGAFDYISGNIPRAPRWVQKIGFEWLYRLIRQPWRIRRQAALLKFIFLVLKEKLQKL